MLTDSEHLASNIITIMETQGICCIIKELNEFIVLTIHTAGWGGGVNIIMSSMSEVKWTNMTWINLRAEMRGDKWADVGQFRLHLKPLMRIIGSLSWGCSHSHWPGVWKFPCWSQIPHCGIWDQHGSFQPVGHQWCQELSQRWPLVADLGIQTWFKLWPCQNSGSWMYYKFMLVILKWAWVTLESNEIIAMKQHRELTLDIGQKPCPRFKKMKTKKKQKQICLVGVAWSRKLRFSLFDLRASKWPCFLIGDHMIWWISEDCILDGG